MNEIMYLSSSLLPNHLVDSGITDTCNGWYEFNRPIKIFI